MGRASPPLCAYSWGHSHQEYRWVQWAGQPQLTPTHLGSWTGSRCSSALLGGVGPAVEDKKFLSTQVMPLFVGPPTSCPPPARKPLPHLPCSLLKSFLLLPGDSSARVSLFPPTLCTQLSVVPHLWSLPLCPAHSPGYRWPLFPSAPLFRLSPWLSPCPPLSLLFSFPLSNLPRPVPPNVPQPL